MATQTLVLPPFKDFYFLVLLFLMLFYSWLPFFNDVVPVCAVSIFHFQAHIDKYWVFLVTSPFMLLVDRMLKRLCHRSIVCLWKNKMKMIILCLLLCHRSTAGRITFKYLFSSSLYFLLSSRFFSCVTLVSLHYNRIFNRIWLNTSHLKGVRVYIYNKKSCLSHSNTLFKDSLHSVFWSHDPPWVCWCCPDWWRWGRILWQQRKDGRNKTELDEKRTGGTPWASTVVHQSVYWVSARPQSRHSNCQPAV